MRPGFPRKPGRIGPPRAPTDDLSPQGTPAVSVTRGPGLPRHTAPRRTPVLALKQYVVQVFSAVRRLALHQLPCCGVLRASPHGGGQAEFTPPLR